MMIDQIHIEIARLYRDKYRQMIDDRKMTNDNI